MQPIHVAVVTSEIGDNFTVCTSSFLEFYEVLDGLYSCWATQLDGVPIDHVIGSFTDASLLWRRVAGCPLPTRSEEHPREVA